MKKLEIAIGDGLLANFALAVLPIVEEITGRHYAYSCLGEFDFLETLDLTAHEAREIKTAIDSRQGFAAALKPYLGARQGVRYLRMLGDVFCVTRPWDSNPWWREERASWLALHFGIERVYHAWDKRSYRADLFVDAWPDDVRVWLSAWPDRTAALWRTSHNVSEPVPTGAREVSSWGDLRQVALEVARGRTPNSTEGEAQ